MKLRYSELIKLKTFNERLDYLQLDGKIGETTFGGHRYLNQALYTSPDWRHFRKSIIVRDSGCDMALEGYEIVGKILVHHLNPLTINDILNRSPKIFDPENVVCVSFDTHELITYSADKLKTMLRKEPVERRKNDTIPWR